MGQDSKLFIRGVLDLKEEIETRLEQCYKGLDPGLSSLPTEKLYESLHLKVCKGSQDHDEIMFGLLYIILTDTSVASKAFRLLTMLTQDSMGLILRELEIIIMEKMHQMKETPRIQIVWLTRELVALNVADAERLCFALLKQTPCGDISERNIIVIEHLLHLLLDFRSWLDSQPALISSVVYTYLSLIPDHVSSSLASLRDEEVSFCASLLQNKFADCMLIGRDLVRLLQNVARIPEFTKIWKDVLLNPQSLAPNFTGLEELLNIRTSRRFIAGRLTSDMETKLTFLTSKVKFGLHKRYQVWFQQKHLSTPESQSLVVDIIRYLCCVVHPTNEVLCSDIIPRWLLIGWLLSLCTYGVVSANAKLALFFDWLSYNKEIDSIMNVEPGILVMYHSLKTYPHITSTLLEFLFSLQYEYSPNLKSAFAKGMRSVFEDVVVKQVIPSSECFFESNSIDDNLKQQLVVLLPASSTTSAITSIVNIEDEANDELEIVELLSKKDEVIEDDDDDDDDEDMDASLDIDDTPAKGPHQSLVEDEGLLLKWKQFDMSEDLKQAVISLSKESDMDNKVVLLNDVLETLLKLQVNDEIVETMTEILTIVLNDELLEGYTVDDSGDIEKPIQCILRLAASNDVILKMITSFQTVQPMMGVYVLQYLNQRNEAFLPYKKLCNETSLHDYLYNDMTVCADNDPVVLFELLPKLYQQFSTDLLGSEEFLNLIVTNVDPQQLCDMICRLMRKEFCIFGADNVSKMIRTSLEWDTFEQICVWQLLNSEEPPVLSVVDLLPDLYKSDHPEALASTLLYTKRAIPDKVLLSKVLQLPSDTHKDCVTALLRHWASSCPSKLGEAFSYHSSLQTVLSSHPSTIYILNHLTDIVQVSSEVAREVFTDKMERVLNALFVEDPLLFKRFEALHELLKCHSVKDNNKPIIENASSEEEDIMPLVKRKRKTNFI
ncbi:integrator complex subunit 3-like [Dysidea avara]|uniref:integrator complex subunit 3-like n=1 Tax=Dysidea avara TaxID=196820 RepID=UPI003332D70D